MMTLPSRRLAAACASLALVMAGLALTGCGSTSPIAPAPLVLLDTTVTLIAGAACNVGYVAAEFTGVAGQSVAVSVTGPVSLTPLVTLYAPDFATQLAGSTSSGAGAAALTAALTQSGTHHLSICDLHGVAGALRVTVTRQ